MNNLPRLQVALVAAAILLSGCGIPEDDVPTALIPATPTPVVEAPTPTPPSTQAFTIYLTSADGRVRPAIREVANPLTISGLLNELIELPTEEENDQGLVSLIPQETTFFQDPSTDNTGLAILDFAAGSFETLEGDLQTQALAQLVWTLTGSSQIDSIIIRIENVGERWPTDTDARNVLRRGDYESFGPDFVEPTPEPIEETPEEEVDPTPAPTATPAPTPTPGESGG